MRLHPFIGLFLFFSVTASAADKAACLTIDEFRALAAEVAPKVDLFRAVWNANSDAEFYGGTSRDFLYWLKGRFRGAETEAECAKRLAELRDRKTIQIREFISEESDVDVLTRSSLRVDATEFGVKKMDAISLDRVNPSTPAGHDEIAQGFIPIEKIRLSAQGVVHSSTFGDGTLEIYSSHLTVHFADSATFLTTAYARANLNHPILLSLRYIRALSIDVYQRDGNRLPSHQLLEHADPASVSAVKNVIRSSVGDPRLGECLNQPRFSFWLKDTARKTFRAYVNPTASLSFYREFGMIDWIARYPAAIDPVNQYVFAKVRNAEEIAKATQKYTDGQKWYSPASEHFSDLRMYHGTKTPSAFRAIMYQGALPSESTRFVGEGLYVVGKNEMATARAYAEGSDDLIVSFPIDPSARIVDITQGGGQAAYQKFTASNPGATIDEFADALGIDVVQYQLSVANLPKRAYAVKNSAVLGQPFAYSRKPDSFAELLALARNVHTPDAFGRFLKIAETVRLVEKEWIELISAAHIDPEVVKTIDAFRAELVQKNVPSGVRANLIAIAVADESIRAQMLSPSTSEAALNSLFEAHGGAIKQLVASEDAQASLKLYAKWMNGRLKRLSAAQQMNYLEGLTSAFKREPRAPGIRLTADIARATGHGVMLVGLSTIMLSFGTVLTTFPEGRMIGLIILGLGVQFAWKTREQYVDIGKRVWERGFKSQLENLRANAKAKKTRNAFLELLQGEIQESGPTCGDLVKPRF